MHVPSCDISVTKTRYPKRSLITKLRTRGAGRRERECQAPDKSTKLRVRSVFFCTNATSGIMRGRHLMCARRKERNNGIAIVTKSIASCCPARRALLNSRRGKHVRKGDIFLYDRNVLKRNIWMKNEERKSPRTGAYLLYVTARGLELDKVIRDLARCKNAILRCITRKKHRGQAVAYFVYVRV